MNGWNLASVGITSGAAKYSGAGGYVPHSGIPPGVSQQISVTAGQAYILTFQTYFASCNGQSMIEVTFGDSQSDFTVTDCQFDVGQLHDNTFNYVATGSTANLMFAFEDTTYYTGGSQTMLVANGMSMSRAIHVQRTSFLRGLTWLRQGPCGFNRVDSIPCACVPSQKLTVKTFSFVGACTPQLLQRASIHNSINGSGLGNIRMRHY